MFTDLSLKTRVYITGPCASKSETQLQNLFMLETIEMRGIRH